MSDDFIRGQNNRGILNNKEWIQEKDAKGKNERLTAKQNI